MEDRLVAKLEQDLFGLIRRLPATHALRTTSGAISSESFQKLVETEGVPSFHPLLFHKVITRVPPLGAPTVDVKQWLRKNGVIVSSGKITGALDEAGGRGVSPAGKSAKRDHGGGGKEAKSKRRPLTDQIVTRATPRVAAAEEESRSTGKRAGGRSCEAAEELLFNTLADACEQTERQDIGEAFLQRDVDYAGSLTVSQGLAMLVDLGLSGDRQLMAMLREATRETREIPYVNWVRKYGRKRLRDKQAGVHIFGGNSGTTDEGVAASDDKDKNQQAGQEASGVDKTPEAVLGAEGSGGIGDGSGGSNGVGSTVAARSSVVQELGVSMKLILTPPREGNSSVSEHIDGDDSAVVAGRVCRKRNLTE
eukprot:g3609.t1